MHIPVENLHTMAAELRVMADTLTKIAEGAESLGTSIIEVPDHSTTAYLARMLGVPGDGNLT